MPIDPQEVNDLIRAVQDAQYRIVTVEGEVRYLDIDGGEAMNAAVLALSPTAEYVASRVQRFSNRRDFSQREEAREEAVSATWEALVETVRTLDLTDVEDATKAVSWATHWAAKEALIMTSLLPVPRRTYWDYRGIIAEYADRPDRDLAAYEAVVARKHTMTPETFLAVRQALDTGSNWSIPALDGETSEDALARVSAHGPSAESVHLAVDDEARCREYLAHVGATLGADVEVITRLAHGFPLPADSPVLARVAEAGFRYGEDRNGDKVITHVLSDDETSLVLGLPGVGRVTVLRRRAAAIAAIREYVGGVPDAPPNGKAFNRSATSRAEAGRPPRVKVRKEKPRVTAQTRPGDWDDTVHTRKIGALQ